MAGCAGIGVDRSVKIPQNIPIGSEGVVVVEDTGAGGTGSSPVQLRASYFFAQASYSACERWQN